MELDNYLFSRKQKEQKIIANIFGIDDDTMNLKSFNKINDLKNIKHDVEMIALDVFIINNSTELNEIKLFLNLKLDDEKNNNELVIGLVSEFENDNSKKLNSKLGMYNNHFVF